MVAYVPESRKLKHCNTSSYLTPRTLPEEEAVHVGQLDLVIVIHEQPPNSAASEHLSGHTAHPAHAHNRHLHGHMGR